VHATLAQPAAGADALKDLRAQRAHEISRPRNFQAGENPMRFRPRAGFSGLSRQNSQDFLHAYNARSLSQDPVPTVKSHLGGPGLKADIADAEKHHERWPALLVDHDLVEMRRRQRLFDGPPRGP
jgi:hypothetical protein